MQHTRYKPSSGIDIFPGFIRGDVFSISILKQPQTITPMVKPSYRMGLRTTRLAMIQHSFSAIISRLEKTPGILLFMIMNKTHAPKYPTDMQPEVFR